MQDQILQTLFLKGNHSNHDGHDGFFDGPGNPIQSMQNFLGPPFPVNSRVLLSACI